MDRAVDGRPARVDADDVADRDERPGLAGERVLQLNGHAAGSSSATASAEIVRPAPSSPDRLPVDALTLTAVGVDAEEARDRDRASRRDARPGAGAPRRSSGRCCRPPSRSPPRGGRPRPASRSRRSPRASTASAGNSRPRSPSPAAPSSASQTACSATSPSEWPWSRGAPSMTTPPSASGPPGPNGWPSWPMPTRDARGPARAASTRRRSAGCVTLMLLGSPGTTWTAILQASSSAASSVHVSGPSGGNRSKAAREQAVAGRPVASGRCRGSHDRRSRRRRHPSIALDGLRDRQDRDRRAVRRRRRR